MEGIVNRKLFDPRPDERGEIEDETYEALVSAALRILGSQEIVSELKSAAKSADPGEAMASIAYGVVAAVGEASGGIDDTYMLSLAAEVLGYVADAMSNMGADVSGKDIAKAMYNMIEQYAMEEGIGAAELEQIRGQIDFDAVAREADAELGTAKPMRAGRGKVDTSSPSGALRTRELESEILP